MFVTQNVCETVQKLNECFDEHKTAFRHPEKNVHPPILSEQLNVELCKADFCKI